MIRPSRVIAIAWRDLLQELKGRRGILFGGVTTLLLLPAAALRIDLPERGEPLVEVFARGDVPDAVLPYVTPTDGKAHMAFRIDDGHLVVRAQGIPPKVRKALDGDTPALTVEQLVQASPRPGRSILFALISASVLTGAISESLGGERSRKTLETLLAASITRLELVTGKWLAWSAYGAAAAYAAALAAMVAGRVDPGWWLLPLGVVAAGAVALAMFLTRHATDVVGGATVSLRWIPAVISLTGIAAWHYGGRWPVLCSGIPIGGALVAAGDTWPGPAPALVGAGSTLLFSAGLLVWTAHDLEEPAPPPSSLARRIRSAALLTVGAALAWIIPVAAPLLWAEAGNATITAGLSPASGALAGALALALIPAMQVCRARDPLDASGLRPAPGSAWPLAVAAGLALSVYGGLDLMPMGGPLGHEASHRMLAAMQPGFAGPVALLLAIAGQELLFREWLQRSVGPVIATIAFVAVHTPLDPVAGLLVGGTLAALTAGSGSLLPALVARMTWALVLPLAAPISPPLAIGIGVAVIAALGIWARRTPLPAAVTASP